MNRPLFPILSEVHAGRPRVRQQRASLSLRLCCSVVIRVDKECARYMMKSQERHHMVYIASIWIRDAKRRRRRECRPFLVVVRFVVAVRVRVLHVFDLFFALSGGNRFPFGAVTKRHARRKHESPRARKWKVRECGEAHGSSQGLGISVHARSVAETMVSRPTLEIALFARCQR